MPLTIKKSLRRGYPFIIAFSVKQDSFATFHSFVDNILRHIRRLFRIKTFKKLSFHYIYASRFVFSIISQSRTKGIVAQMNFYNLIKRVSADTVTFHGKNFCFIAHCCSNSLRSAFACGVYHMELYLT